MKSVSLRFSPTILMALFTSAALATAGDVIKLKTGEKLDGKILSKTATEVQIEVSLGKIKDLKKVAVKDIAEIIEATPDQFEAAELAKLVPSEDGLSDNSYQKIITDKLEAFLKKYPASKFRKDVEAIIATYKDELAKAKGGAKKIEGNWVLPAELNWNAYNIEARLKRAEMQKLLKEDKVAEAYRVLAELEAQKGASIETVSAIESFKAILPKFAATIDRLILEHPIKVKARAESTKPLSPDQKKIFEDTVKREEADLKLRQEEDRKMKLGILSYSEWDLKSLNDSKAALEKETARLTKLDLTTTKAAATAFQSGLKNFSEKTYLSAQRNFEDAAKVFQKDAFVKEQTELAKKAAAEVLRAANEANAAKPAPLPDPKADPKAGTKAKEPAKTEGGQPVKKTAAAGPDSEAKTDAEATPEASSSSSLSVILIGGAAALLIILLIVKALAKKKASADD